MNGLVMFALYKYRDPDKATNDPVLTPEDECQNKDNASADIPADDFADEPVEKTEEKV